MAYEKVTNFPGIPFDGQEFIDAFRMKWVYDGEVKCWKRIGTVQDIPVATAYQDGLLSRNFKQMLDSIPDKGGHFGIIANPLLSVVPQEIDAKVTDKVSTAVKNESGSIVFGAKPIAGQPYASEIYSGHFLRFTKGQLKNESFLIFTNDETSFILDGDASSAANKDEFIVFDPLQANEQGAIMGNIKLVSETLDINCVDGRGDPVTVVGDCRLDYMTSDAGPTAPGLNLEVAEKVLDNFCVELRSCKGSKGAKGPVGAAGADGTGDGPAGEQGDPGEDAPDVANTFSGTQFVESEDVYDTVVVGLELDAPRGKLNILKAKALVPSDDTPATQVIASPLERSITWSDEEFGYTLLKPLNDPIETKTASDADVDLAAYPAGYEILTDGLPDDIASARVTQFNTIKLSGLVDKAIDFFRGRLTEISDNYDKQIKIFIEEKDTKARGILADLAQQLAECEWELPIDFCLGITPDDCREEDNPPGGEPPPDGYTPTPYPHPEDFPPIPTPHTHIPPIDTPVPGPQGSPTPSPSPSPTPTPTPTPSPSPTPKPADTIIFTDVTWNGSTTLPNNIGASIKYSRGALRVKDSVFFVSPLMAGGLGAFVFPRLGPNWLSPIAFPGPSSYDPHDLIAVEAAYKAADARVLLQPGSFDRITFGATIAKDAVSSVEALIENSLHFLVNLVFPADEPIAGIKTVASASVKTSEEEQEPEVIVNSVDPNLIAEGPFITQITVYGSGFADGLTPIITGPTNVSLSNLVAVAADGHSCTIDITLDVNPAEPAPNDYDLTIINIDGTNGILVSAFTTGA